MKRIRFGAAALNQTPLDWKGNRERILEAISLSRRQSTSVLCLPELAITGYGCEDMFLSPEVCARALEELNEIVPATAGMAVAIGMPLQHRGAVFNVAAMLLDGELLGFAAKQNLAGDGLHYEPRWFKPWSPDETTLVDIDGRKVPFGDLIFEIGGVRLGFEICEDAWVADRPGSGLAARGVDIILNPSASHFAFGKQEIRRRFVLEGARAFSVTYVYANLLGNEAGRIIYDGGCIIASGGSLLAEGDRLSFRDVLLTTAVADIDVTRQLQMRTVSRDLRVDDRANSVSSTFSFDVPDGSSPPPVVQPVDFSKEAAFTRAISLGLFDYARKSRAKGFVISLSGGSDSAAVACLVATMLRLARSELGDEFAKKWHASPNLAELLTCVYQTTEHSSATTRNAAARLAEALGAAFVEWNVDDLVAGYVSRAEKVIERTLTWEQDDVALQNVQARVRAPGVWLLANQKNALLLSTSNRSEAAVGYATMDGDTCGGLCPISGIDKAFLRHWLRWLETEGAENIPAIPALEAVNSQRPTAELRPASAGQTDEDDLMPYPVLDAIEEAAIRDKRLPASVRVLIAEQFPEYSREQVDLWVKRFFTLWTRNQWKRERYAPGFHVDDKNLDPKTWCRFPILSSGFAEELR